jgi:glycerophosphoryl diester phosphodiesterase
VYVQSFETGNLLELRAMTRVKLLRLVGDEPELLTDEGLRRVRGFADGIGLHKRHVIADDGVATGLVERAHAAGLEVHVYTFRTEARHLSPWCGGDYAVELGRFLALGVDGVFADQPDAAVRVRDAR